MTYKVNIFWINFISQMVELYSTLQYLQSDSVHPGSLHPLLLNNITSYRDITRQAVKLKMVTGTYMLQSTRAVFNHLGNGGSDSETLVHMLLVCEKLEYVRNLILEEMMCVIELIELDTDIYSTPKSQKAEKLGFIVLN